MRKNTWAVLSFEKKGPVSSRYFDNMLRHKAKTALSSYPIFTYFCVVNYNQEIS